jgi:DNA replication protein DnaC
MSSVLSDQLNVRKRISGECEHFVKYGSGCPDCLEIERQQEEKIKERERLNHENEMAQRREHPDFWLREYGVPNKYLASSFDNFIGGIDAAKACMAFPKHDVVLIGKTGCGKTHLSAATMRKMVINNEIKTARFTTVPRLLMDIRDCFKDKTSENEKEIVNRYVSYGFLFLDDLGSDRATEWAIETLYLIIDGRDSNLKPTFITTNLSVLEIEQHYGARIASRISGKTIININLPDYRKKRS